MPSRPITVPVRSMSAALTVLFAGPAAVLAPGDEFRLGRDRFRLAHIGVDGLRAVPLDGQGDALEIEVSATSLTYSESCAPFIPRLVALAEEFVLAAVVVGAAIVCGGRVLAQQRAYPPEVAGMWELPGGGVEPGESDVDAVRRECVEELGVVVEPGTILGPDIVLKPGLVLRIYTAILREGEPHPHDHQALDWLSADTLYSVRWLPADRVVLPAVADFLRAH